MLADNKLALNAGWDLEMLSLEIGELGEAGFDLSLTSAGFAGYRRQFGFGAVIGVLLVDDLRDFEQPITGGIGGNRVGEPVIHPIECADAVLLAKLELGLPGHIDDKIITADPDAFSVFVHEHCGRPAIGRQQTPAHQPKA